MAVEIKLQPHICKQKTQWGAVEKPLNQHIVSMKNAETGQFVQCGYVGDTAFLPLSGFPQELCEPVAAECAKQLGKPVAAGVAPPGLEELVAIVSQGAGGDDE